MSTLEKKLRALADGKDLPWDRVVSILRRRGVEVQAPSGGGSHFKVFLEGHPPLTIPVHNNRIKKVYAKQIADFLEGIIDI